MRLFILSSTPLRHIADKAEAGDTVAWFRLGQDIRGDWRQTLEARGVKVIHAEQLVSVDEGHRIERDVRRQASDWYMDDGRSQTVSPGGVDFAPFISADIIRSNNFFYLVKAALIFDRLLKSVEGCSGIVTDIRNGEFIYLHSRREPEVMLWRDVLDDMAAARDLPVAQFKDGERLPVFTQDPQRWTVRDLLRSMVLGIRPKQVLSKCRLWLRPKSKPRTYVFNGRDRNGLISRLAGMPRIETVADYHGDPAVFQYQSRGVFPFPYPDVLVAGWRLLRRVSRVEKNPPVLTFMNVDVGPYLLKILQRKVRGGLLGYLVVAAQMMRLVRDVKPTAVVVNADCTLDVMILSDLAQRSNFAVYFVNHSYDYGAFLLCSSVYSDPDMVYVAESVSQAPIYGAWHPERERFRIPVVTTTQMLSMGGVKGRRSKDNRRILATNYSSFTPHVVTRTHVYDEYLLCLVRLAEELAEDGIELVYRPHPAEKEGMLRGIEREWRGEEIIKIDDSPDFATALARCDAHVSGISTCYYQSLYAGWPTIFFDPAFDAAEYIGLPADADTGRPVATTLDDLLRLVRQTYDPDSDAAKFPAAFNGELAAHYMGENPDQADVVLADFFVKETAATSA